MENQISWKLGISYKIPRNCYHGGAFFDAIGDRFDHLERIDQIINADVLDAWFPPAPAVQKCVQDHLAWAMRTSPPTSARGMEEVIAEARGVRPENILIGGGSSDLIYLAFQHWLTSKSRALILDPTYGEYAHVLEKVIGCEVVRYHLERDNGYRVDTQGLSRILRQPFDIFVWVNPNSPSGLHVGRDEIVSVLNNAHPETKIWMDETYVEYAGKEHSLESHAVKSRNLVICKSMSKVYALSGMRAAYLCTSPHQLEDLRMIAPPWSVGLLSQMAAVMAIQSDDYYDAYYQKTHVLRRDLIEGLRALGISEIIPGVANFILFHLPEDGITADSLVRKCRTKGLFLRNVSGMGSRMGAHGVRIAVKDSQTNTKMLEIIRDCLVS